jgi:hypothetical protein
MTTQLETEVLVVGGGTGGTAAALQAARRGVRTLLVSEFPWLGGMLTSAGVSAPDGNELLAFQTGIWGAFLRELQQRQPGGLDHAWVSFFTYDPRIGAEIFADWVKALPNLQWISGQVPLEVLKQGDRVLGVRFADVTVRAAITLDGTELGDLLALGEMPHRWGWEFQSEFQEPSAPVAPTALTQRYPVQAPTWVVVMQDYGPDATAPEILALDRSDRGFKAWANHGVEQFLNYGRLPGDRFMINWPIHGNDYGEGLERLVASEAARQAFERDCLNRSQQFARTIQTHLGRRYGLAEPLFPRLPGRIGGGAFALHPYYRESRRLRGQRTLCEQAILPVSGERVAALPINQNGEVSAIAIGNYANDHHYPGGEIPLQPKSMRWGGRWTGTPFTIPYDCLIPEHITGFLVCEKNISVSHLANGATRLQPVVLGIGQAAGMAAALCIEQSCDLQDLSVRALQTALLDDPTAPAAVIPLLNLPPYHPDWLSWQHRYLEQPESYPVTGNCPNLRDETASFIASTNSALFSGRFQRRATQDYALRVVAPDWLRDRCLQLVTLAPPMNEQMENLQPEQPLTISARINLAGNWLLVQAIHPAPMAETASR